MLVLASFLVNRFFAIFLWLRSGKYFCSYHFISAQFSRFPTNFHASSAFFCSPPNAQPRPLSLLMHAKEKVLFSKIIKPYHKKMTLFVWLNHEWCSMEISGYASKSANSRDMIKDAMKALVKDVPSRSWVQWIHVFIISDFSSFFRSVCFRHQQHHGHKLEIGANLRGMFHTWGLICHQPNTHRY